MTKRREFPRAIKVVVIRRATRDGQVYCEKCGALAKRFQIDHVIADSHGGDPILANAELICEPCFSVKNLIDTTIAAKLKRCEAKAIGATRPAGTIPSRPSQPAHRKHAGRPALPPKLLYQPIKGIQP